MFQQKSILPFKRERWGWVEREVGVGRGGGWGFIYCCLQFKVQTLFTPVCLLVYLLPVTLEKHSCMSVSQTPERQEQFRDFLWERVTAPLLLSAVLGMERGAEKLLPPPLSPPPYTPSHTNTSI